MFNKFIFAMLFLASVFTPSVTTLQADEQAHAVDCGNSLTVTYPTPGTAVLNWEFSQPAIMYSIIIDDDQVMNRTVRTAYTAQTNITFTDLPPGAYLYKVSNGTDEITVQGFVTQ